MARLTMIPHSHGGRTWLNLDNVCSVGDRPHKPGGETGEVVVFSIGDTEECHHGFKYGTGAERDDILRALGVPEFDLQPVIQCGGEG